MVDEIDDEIEAFYDFLDREAEVSGPDPCRIERAVESVSPMDDGSLVVQSTVTGRLTTGDGASSASRRSSSTATAGRSATVAGGSSALRNCTQSETAQLISPLAPPPSTFTRAVIRLTIRAASRPTPWIIVEETA